MVLGLSQPTMWGQSRMMNPPRLPSGHRGLRRPWQGAAARVIRLLYGAGFRPEQPFFESKKNDAPLLPERRATLLRANDFH
jgi:hypothetical protein